MTHPDGKEASHPRAPTARRGRGKRAKADLPAEPAAEWAAGHELYDDSPAAEDAALAEETPAPPEPVHAPGAGRAALLSEYDHNEEGDEETAKPFLYDDDEELDEDPDAGVAADDFSGFGEELADKQALLRRAGQILGSLGREQVVAGDDDEADEDGEFQWADDDLPEEQVTLVDEEWLLKVASHAVRRVAARAGDAPTIEGSADPDALRPPPAKLELTLLEPALLARLQTPGAPAMRREQAAPEEPAADTRDEDEAELVPLLTEAAYEAAVAEAETAQPEAEAEIGAFAPTLEPETEPAVPDEPSSAAGDSIGQGSSGFDLPIADAGIPSPELTSDGTSDPTDPAAQPTDEAVEVELTAKDEPTAEDEPTDAAGDYHALMLGDSDAAPSPGPFEDFAARGRQIPEPAAVAEAPAHPAITPSIVPTPISVSASHTGVDPFGAAAAAAPAETNSIMAPQLMPEQSVSTEDPAGRNQSAPEPVIAGEVASRESAPEEPAPHPMSAAKPPLVHEFAVPPVFDIAEALAPEPEQPADCAADEGVPPEEFNDDDGESQGWDGDAPLGYESAREPTVAGGRLRGGGWTIPLLCLGIGLIACCLLIPLADSNRRLAYERQRLGRDLESIQTQVAVNDEFLRRVHDDASLAERLAQRQMKTIRQGTRVLELGRPRAGATADMSPFQLVAVQPPAPLPPYRPLRGTIANLCYRPRTRLYLMGVGLFLMASGLVLGYAPKRG